MSPQSPEPQQRLTVGWGSNVADPIRDAVEDAVEAVFLRRDKQSDLTRDTHTAHHIWLAQQIERVTERAEFWRTMRTKTLPWAIVALGSWIATSIWAFLTGHWK